VEIFVVVEWVFVSECFTNWVAGFESYFYFGMCK